MSIDTENGMAAGNLAIELEHALHATGRFGHEYAMLVRKLLEDALSSKMHLRYGSLEAIQDFKEAG